MSDLWLIEYDRAIEDIDEDDLEPTREKLKRLGLSKDEIEETLYAVGAQAHGS